MGKARSIGGRKPRTVRPFHLFVYGTLMVPSVFRAVLGHRLVTDPDAADDAAEAFCAREAVLAGYKKICPDGTYLYAVPDAHGRIRGYVVGPLPGDCLAALRRYEGKNYRQRRVRVHTASDAVEAVVFVGNLDELSHGFGWAFRDPLKQEVLLRRTIDRALLADEMDRLHTDEELTRRALSELHGRTIRDLMRHHFDAGGISGFAIRQAIREEPLREFGDLAADADARRTAPSYLTLLARQVLFNQVEDRIREEFRYELDAAHISERYYERTLSSLATLRVLNAQQPLLDLLAGDMLTDLPFAEHRLIDYVRWAVEAADAVYDPARAQRELRYLGGHMSPGAIPLGVELEFSNTGHEVIRDPLGRRDGQYDGFYYFRDFALDILTWKLGGHVDDHRVKSSTQRRRGFFELALGSLSVEANISKPITDDPWLLNQFVHAAMAFYDVAPHSLHVSLQLRSPNRPVQDRPLPLGVMKCLFALAGDPVRGPDGTVRVARLGGEEILRAKPARQMLFSQIARRRSVVEDEPVPAARGRWVQQFKFLRLSPEINYEPIIVALKGLQVRYKPGTFLAGPQYASSAPLRGLFEDLLAWGGAATPLGPEEIETFLAGVYEGLTTERRGRPAHRPAYIAYCLALLRAGLNAFNARVSGAPTGGERSGGL